MSHKTNNDPCYSELYLDDFSEEVGYAFEFIASKKCDVFRTLDFFLQSSIFYEVYTRANPKYLNMSSRQLIECISYDDGFEWFKTTPIKEDIDIDPNIAEWLGNLITYFQWNYRIDFRDWLKYFSTRDIYNMYNPLHEASYQVASDKLAENYDYMMRKKQE